MWSLLTALPSLLTDLFSTVNSITAAISNEKIALIGAETAEDKAIIESNLEALQARRDVMIAEAGKSKLNIIMRTALALGPAVILNKIFIWDKVIGSIMGCAGKAGEAASCATYTTDALDPNLWNVVMVIVGFYFLSEGMSSVSRILKLK